MSILRSFIAGKPYHNSGKSTGRKKREPHCGAGGFQPKNKIDNRPPILRLNDLFRQISTN
jgi:hypothetical protein